MAERVDQVSETTCDKMETNPFYKINLSMADRKGWKMITSMQKNRSLTPVIFSPPPVRVGGQAPGFNERLVVIASDLSVDRFTQVVPRQHPARYANEAARSRTFPVLLLAVQRTRSRVFDPAEKLTVKT